VSARLHPDRLAALPAAVIRPAYTPAQHGIGIAHLGLGAFHRAHQAWYLDEVLARSGGDWRIAGISCRSPIVRDQLQPQSGLYTVVVRSAAGSHYRVIGSLAQVLVAPEDLGGAIAAMAAPTTQLITLTVTEKGYCRDSASGHLDVSHPEIVHDLARPAQPRSAPGLLLAALRQRQQLGVAAPTILCCDNLPENGRAVRCVMLELAAHLDPAFAAWIEREVRFPCTMVDRIVPATTPADITAAASLLGAHDAALVVTEPFSQWVVEDAFAGPRPELEVAGVQVVRDVRPFELAKLRLLNGSHSTLAYVGSLVGYTFVHEAIADAEVRALLVQMMSVEVVPTLSGTPADELARYQAALLARFRNPALQHRLRQIAMDGSQKLPQRLLGTVTERLSRGESSPALTLAIAAWMRYVTGRAEDGQRYNIDDPLAARLAGAVAAAGPAAESLAGELLGIVEIFGTELPRHTAFRAALVQDLDDLLRLGAHRTLRTFVARLRSGWSGANC
jgi:fructuronate reductase